jgi:DNA-binding response OmpR family regulator
MHPAATIKGKRLRMGFDNFELHPLYHRSFRPPPIAQELIMKSPAPRILIVDDDRDSSELMQLMLQHSDASYEITSVLSPEEGLRLASARGFDLYVLDCRFVGINGLEVCRRLRQTDSKTPIMFFTGEAQESVRQKALRAGADAYLIKPDDLKKLTGTVARLLGVHNFAEQRDMTTNNHNESALST